MNAHFINLDSSSPIERNDCFYIHFGEPFAAIPQPSFGYGHFHFIPQNAFGYGHFIFIPQNAYGYFTFTGQLSAFGNVRSTSTNPFVVIPQTAIFENGQFAARPLEASPQSVSRNIESL